MATDSLVQQAITLLQESLQTAPTPTPTGGWAALIASATTWLTGMSNPPAPDSTGALQIAEFKAEFPSLGLIHVAVEYASAQGPTTPAQYKLAGVPVPEYIAQSLVGNPAAGVVAV